MNEDYIVSYAQNREDIILSCFFDENETGFYIDVGANDPTIMSVTKYFYDRGWTGINIEPIPDIYKKLTRDRKSDINLNISLGQHSGEAVIHYYPKGDGLSTMSEDMYENYLDEQLAVTENSVDIKIKVKTLEDVIKQYASNRDISFLKVDVEGFEYEVLMGNDWSKYRPQVICIEANHILKKWKSILIENNFSLVFFDGLNEYYVDNTTNRAKKFDYTNILLRPPIINYIVAKDIEQKKTEINQSRNKIIDLQSEVANLSSSLNITNLLLRETKVQYEELIARHEQIISFRKHFRVVIFKRLKMVDRIILKKIKPNESYYSAVIQDLDKALNVKQLLNLIKQNDDINFNTYNNPLKEGFTLKLYNYLRNKAKKMISSYKYSQDGRR